MTESAIGDSQLAISIWRELLVAPLLHASGNLSHSEAAHPLPRGGTDSTGTAP